MVDVFDDIQIMAYVLDNGKYNITLSKIASNYLDYTTEFVEENINDPQVITQIIHELYPILKTKLIKEKLLYLYEVEHDLITVLKDMEQQGILIDVKQLQQLKSKFSKRLELVTQKIYDISNEKFNIASAKQLGDVLFNKLGLHLVKKSKKTGNLSTSSSIIEELEHQGHKIATYILEWRHLAKLCSTYIDGIIKLIDENTNKIHTKFHSTKVSTGRISTSEPNLQSIPIRTEEGSNIRKAFIAHENKKILTADYSQIELRVLTHLADIPAMTDAFIKQQDVHSRTAAEIFALPLKQVTKEMRAKAKTINFGIIYGLSTFGLSTRLKISMLEAKEFITKYMQKYHGIKEYKDKILAECNTNKYVTTLMGRKIFFPNISTKGPNRMMIERSAINAPIQGTVADIMKMVMIKIYNSFQAKKLKSKLLLQIHDELLFEITDDEVDLVKKIILQEMTNVVTLKVPLKVDIDIGNSWHKEK